MTGRTRITGIMTAVFMAGVMAGCSVQTGNQVAPTAERQQTKGTVQETELQKPIHPEPSQIQPFPDIEKKTKAEPLIGGRRIILMTDMHCLVESLTDQRDMFQAIVEHGNGELTNYAWEITDTTLEEVRLLSPDVLIISGDLSLQGEKKSHEELAKRLGGVEKTGITVSVIPGSHDINSPSASAYSGEDRYPAEPTTSEDLERIYKKFGHSEASSRGANSLDCAYDLGPSMRPPILDTCRCEPRNKVGGMIKTETYEWIREQLGQAIRDSMILLPVAHHNLLEESGVYTDDCTIEHSEELIQMLEGENIPLFLSGHLYVQRFMRDNDIGIYEVVTGFLSTPPCQYGVLGYMEDRTSYYYTRKVNMEKWTRENKSTDENLLNFDACGPPVLKQIFYNQAYDAMKNSAEEETGSILMKLTESEKQQMAKVYGDINAAYYGDGAYGVMEEAMKQPGYSVWKEYCYPSILCEYLKYIIEDAAQDYNVLSIE